MLARLEVGAAWGPHGRQPRTRSSLPCIAISSLESPWEVVGLSLSAGL